MAKRCRESDSSDTATAYNTVFIDTNLDTHLAMIVSDADTVSDLKKKIIFEHPQCFPKIGEIKIHALKVKRKGYFYHLSESMLVKSAFEGAKGNWFLSVDASSLKENGENQNASNEMDLLCIINNPLGDRRNLFPDDPSKRLSIVHESLLLQPEGIQCAKQKVPIVDQSNLRDSFREVSKDMETEFKHITNDHCKTLSSGATRRSKADLEIRKDDVISEGNKVPGTTAEHKDDNSRDGIHNIQCNNSLEYSSKSPAVKKKRKIKKHKEDVVCDHARKDNNASIHASSKDTSPLKIVGPESSLVDAGGEVSNDMNVGNKDVSEESCKTSSLDANKRSDTGLHRKYNLHGGTAEVPGIHVEYKNEKSKNKIGDVQCNYSFQEASQSGPAVKKKRKIESKEGSGNPSEENKSLISNSTKETSNLETIIHENYMKDKQKSRNAASDSSFTEPLEDDHSRTNSGSRKKKRRRKKNNLLIPHDQVATVMHSSVQDVGEERSSKEHVEIKNKDFGMLFDAAIVPGQSIQHEALSEPSGISQKEKPSEPVKKSVEQSKVSSSSIGTYICEPDSGNVKGKSDAPEVAAEFGVKGTKYSKQHHDTNMKEFPALAIKEPCRSAHENIVPDDHKIETDQTDEIEEARELLLNHDPEVMLIGRCKPLYQGEADVNVKEPVLSDKLSNANGIMESGKSGGGMKKKKRAKKSAARKQDSSGTEHANNTVSGVLTAPNSGFNDHHSFDETKKDKSTLSRNERKEVSKQKSGDTSSMGADREGDNVTGNEAESLPLTQMNRTQENAENVDDKSRKNVKRIQSSTAKSLRDLTIKEPGNVVECLQLNQINRTRGNVENMDKKLKKTENQNSAAKSNPDLPIKEKEVNVGELTASNDEMRELDTPSKTTKKIRSVNTNAVNQLTRSELELEKNTGIECGSFHPEQISRSVDSSQVPSSHTLEDNSNGRPEAKVDVENHIEVSKSEGDRINFKHYFLPGAHQNEAPAEEVKDATISDREVKGKKTTKKPVVHSVGTSPDLQNSFKSYENQKSEQKSYIRNSSSIQLQESMSKDEHNDVMLQSKNKSSKVSGTGVKAQHSHDIDQIKTPKARRPDAVNGSGTSRPSPAYPKGKVESSAASSSSSESSGRSLQNAKPQSSLDRYHVTVRKASSKKTGEVMNSSQPKKSLLNTPGSIFRDGSSESSGDEIRTVNSDASTRTPDNSLSDYSPRNGSYGAKRKEGGGKNIFKSQSPGPKNATMDVILRGSSRFKKAKLTASQSHLEETESQPLDFVPDSQANM